MVKVEREREEERGSEREKAKGRNRVETARESSFRSRKSTKAEDRVVRDKQG